MSSQTQSEPLLYAELLPNIRQITLYVSCSGSSSIRQGPNISNPSADRSSSKLPLSLSASRRTVSLPVPNGVRTLHLPAPVSESAHAILATPPASTQPSAKDNEMLFRLPAEVGITSLGPSGSFPGQASPDNNGVQVPWTAKDMCSETRVRCRQCKNMFFSPPKNGETLWKDLPSADWAEMMDLWHCHKPDAPDDSHDDATNGNSHQPHDENEVVKGYGAANRVVCVPGTILIDVLSFVIAEGDCQGLKRLENSPASSTAPSLSKQDQTDKSKARPVVILSCSRCDVTVGEEHPSLSGLRLYKANVSVLRNPASDTDPEDGLWETHPVDMIVGTQLLELVERVGARRFAVHSPEYEGIDSRDSKSGLLLWVFNPDLRYSSEGSGASPDEKISITSQRAMKIFYQEVPDIQLMLNPPQGAPSPAALEDLGLPANIYDSMKRQLEESSHILPVSARQFREWRVGLFSRFEAGG
ncbi:hypothetical protein AJ79_05635 [Helicocarpus griseus UAMH5409]|uniref:Ubiquitin-conjugating enzyme E2-binding protein n=1 Tax=Helicocarpus griseus UAMH5409 TaxID=1447875 RepID=A0A2B7XL47_9EURO|nr:hypothetical protein AJ79_05635 [Helicocarpus griseus UAMH5409]